MVGYVYNLKTITDYVADSYNKDKKDFINPYLIQDFQEIKTTWHPVGM